MTTAPLLIALLAASCPVAGDGWENFRGPGGQGISAVSSLPTRLTDQDIRWRVPCGAGHSSPVVHEGGAYLTTVDLERSVREVHRIDVRSGAVQWSFEAPFEPHPQHRFNSFASSTVAVDEEGVYVVWTSGEALIAISIGPEGEERWRRSLGAFQAQHGSASSPIVVGGVLIVANDNEGKESFIAGLDTATGETKWSVPRASERAAYGSPIVMADASGAKSVLFASTEPAVTAIDPETGAVRWELSAGLTERTVATPALCGDLLFLTLGSGGGGKEALVVRLPGESGAPEVAYRPDRNLPYVPSVLSLEGRFYLFSDGGIVSCLEASTGEVLWKERVEGTFYSSPVSDGRSIYIASREGELFTVTPEGEARVSPPLDVGDTVFATPAIHGGALFLRTASELIRIGSAAAP